MSLYIVGLGNPDPQYSGTRHNIGRDIIKAFAKKAASLGQFRDFELEKKAALISEGKINPVRSSRGALNPAFAKTDRHSSPWQATGRSASNGVNGKVSLVIKAAIGEGNSVHGEARL